MARTAGSGVGESSLSGTNAVQDDRDLIILARKCGDEFVKRRDDFLRAYARQCRVGGGRDAVDACALSLGDEYGFPDERCTADGPLAKLRRAGGISEIGRAHV